jgi:hypothetical protein
MLSVCWQVCLSDNKETDRQLFMLFVCWQVCLSNIREETGIYSCFLFVGRCLISGRRQAPIHAFCLLAGVPVWVSGRRQASIHAFCLLAGVPVWYQGGDRHLFMHSVCWQVCLSGVSGRRQASIHAFCCWQVCLSDIRVEAGTYSCFMLLAGVPVWYQGRDRHQFMLSVCWQVCLSHRVGRVLSISPVVGIGTPPTPHPQASVPPRGSGGRGKFASERGVWESPNFDEGTYTVVLFIFT